MGGVFSGCGLGSMGRRERIRPIHAGRVATAFERRRFTSTRRAAKVARPLHCSTQEQEKGQEQPHPALCGGDGLGCSFPSWIFQGLGGSMAPLPSCLPSNSSSMTTPTQQLHRGPVVQQQQHQATRLGTGEGRGLRASTWSRQLPACKLCLADVRHSSGLGPPHLVKNER
jgi:hypothetical protein